MGTTQEFLVHENNDGGTDHDRPRDGLVHPELSVTLSGAELHESESPDHLEAAEVALPPGWYRYYNDEGFPYYYNEGTGQSLWELPHHFEHVSDTVGLSPRVDESQAVRRNSSRVTATAAGSVENDPQMPSAQPNSAKDSSFQNARENQTRPVELAATQQRVRDLEHQLLELQTQLQAAKGPAPEVVDEYAAGHPEIVQVLADCRVGVSLLLLFLYQSFFFIRMSVL